MEDRQYVPIIRVQVLASEISSFLYVLFYLYEPVPDHIFRSFKQKTHVFKLLFPAGMSNSANDRKVLDPSHLTHFKSILGLYPVGLYIF